MPRTPRKWWSISREYLIPEATVTRTSGKPAIYLPLSIGEKLPPGTKVALLVMVKSSSAGERAATTSERAREAEDGGGDEEGGE